MHTQREYSILTLCILTSKFKSFVLHSFRNGSRRSNLTHTYDFSIWEAEAEECCKFWTSLRNNEHSDFHPWLLSRVRSFLQQKRGKERKMVERDDPGSLWSFYASLDLSSRTAWTCSSQNCFLPIPSVNPLTFPIPLWLPVDTHGGLCAWTKLFPTHSTFHLHTSWRLTWFLKHSLLTNLVSYLCVCHPFSCSD